jgi:glycosyltransferase involved in cell wall biosynthesis
MAEKISECLDSIFKQTYKDYEILIVNDGSTDNLDESIQKSLSKLSKDYNYQLRVINQKNQGAPAARNRGWKESTGEYIFFCDADAVLEPNALVDLMEPLKVNPDISYVFSSFKWGRKIFRVGEFSAEKLKKGPFIHTMSLIKREHLPQKGWDESVKKFQDWDLYLTMLEEGHTGVWIDKVLFSIKPGGTISSWMPSFVYRLMPWLSSVKKYNKAVEIVRMKHGI